MSLERQLVDFSPGVFDPDDDASDQQHAAKNREHHKSGHADQHERDRDGAQHGQDARTGQMDLLAGRRDVGIERAHET